MEQCQITDRMVYNAMNALGDDLKNKKLDTIFYDDLYAPNATEEELDAYSELWGHLISIIETRWSYSKGSKQNTNAIMGTPLSMIAGLLGKNFTRYEKNDLVYKISERLMISSLAAFKRTVKEEDRGEGLAQQYLGFMFTAFCYEVLNLKKQRAKENEKNQNILSLYDFYENAKGGKKRIEGMLTSTPAEGKSAFMFIKREIEDRQYTKGYRDGIIFLESKDEDLPLVLCINESAIETFHASLSSCLSPIQQDIVEFHLLHVIGELDKENQEKLNHYIATKLGLSLGAYTTQLSRIRTALYRHFEQAAGNKKEEN